MVTCDHTAGSLGWQTSRARKRSPEVRWGMRARPQIMALNGVKYGQTRAGTVVGARGKALRHAASCHMRKTTATTRAAWWPACCGVTVRAGQTPCAFRLKGRIERHRHRHLQPRLAPLTSPQGTRRSRLQQAWAWAASCACRQQHAAPAPADHRCHRREQSGRMRPSALHRRRCGGCARSARRLPVAHVHHCCQRQGWQ